jgi:hypothetical protein
MPRQTSGSSQKMLSFALIEFSSRAKAARSCQNRRAYKRRTGRQGSQTLQPLPRLLVSYADEPLPHSALFVDSLRDTTLLHNLELIQWDREPPYQSLEALSDRSEEEDEITQRLIVLMHARRLQLELAREDNRLMRYTQGDIDGLREDMMTELGHILKKAKGLMGLLWRNTQSSREGSMAVVHLQWHARAASNLHSELTFLNTHHDLRGYKDLIESRGYRDVL